MGSIFRHPRVGRVPQEPHTASLKPTQQWVEKWPVHPEPQTPSVTKFHPALGSPCPPYPPCSGPTGSTGPGRGLEGQADGDTISPGMWVSRSGRDGGGSRGGEQGGGRAQTSAPARCRPTNPMMPQGTRHHNQTGRRFWTSRIPAKGSPQSREEGDRKDSCWEAGL